MNFTINNGHVTSPRKDKSGYKKAVSFNYRSTGALRPIESVAFSKESLEQKANVYSDIGDWSMVMVEDEIQKLKKRGKVAEKLLEGAQEKRDEYKSRSEQNWKDLKAVQKERSKLKKENKVLTKRLATKNKEMHALRGEMKRITKTTKRGNNNG
jgi:chromosome segregation ATPase